MPYTRRFRNAGGWLMSAVRLLFLSPLVVGRFIVAQARGTWTNIVGFYRWFQFDYVLPPAIVSTLQWLFEKTPKMFGLRNTDSYWQVAASMVLILVAISSAILTWGLTIATVGVAGLFLLIGFLRFIPVFNSAWRTGRNRIPVRDDYDIPRWERD